MDPLETEEVLKVLKCEEGSNRNFSRENSKVEFKQSFSFGSIKDYLKTMAAFSNNKGGYIFFGIQEKPHVICGLNHKSLEQFEGLKAEELTKTLSDYFDPCMEWEHNIITIGVFSIGYIYTYENNAKPCICKKVYSAKESKHSLKEGEIYYRYGARTERIHYTELSKILNEQREREAMAWMKHFERILHVGPTNIATVDLNFSDVVFPDGKGFVIDKALAKELLKKVKVVEAGSFVENGGKPTLKLVGSLTFAEEIPVPDLDINLKYPYIQKEMAELLGVSTAFVQALIWKYGLWEERKYTLFVQASSKNKFPNKKYSKYALQYLREIIESNEDPEFEAKLRIEYARRNKK